MPASRSCRRSWARRRHRPPARRPGLRRRRAARVRPPQAPRREAPRRRRARIRRLTRRLRRRRGLEIGKDLAAAAKNVTSALTPKSKSTKVSPGREEAQGRRARLLAGRFVPDEAHQDLRPSGVRDEPHAQRDAGVRDDREHRGSLPALGEGPAGLPRRQHRRSGVQAARDPGDARRPGPGDVLGARQLRQRAAREAPSVGRSDHRRGGDLAGSCSSRRATPSSCATAGRGTTTASAGWATT